MLERLGGPGRPVLAELQQGRFATPVGEGHAPGQDTEIIRNGAGEPHFLQSRGTLIAFRLGAEDAEMMAREFEPVFSRRDLLTLPNHDIYLKLMIDGAPSHPFSATTVRPDAGQRHQ